MQDRAIHVFLIFCASLPVMAGILFSKVIGKEIPLEDAIEVTAIMYACFIPLAIGYITKKRFFSLLGYGLGFVCVLSEKLYVRHIIASIFSWWMILIVIKKFGGFKPSYSNADFFYLFGVGLPLGIVVLFWLGLLASRIFKEIKKEAQEYDRCMDRLKKGREES